MTCNECEHKINDTCPWRYLYDDTDYAEDCMDFWEDGTDLAGDVEIGEGTADEQK